MKKIIKLINNERMSAKIASISACSVGAIDICHQLDYAHCTTHAYDYCTKADYGMCSNWEDDVCGIDYCTSGTSQIDV